MNQDDVAMEIKILVHAYNPLEVKIKEGEAIRFSNEDQDEHSITADNEEFDEELKAGESMIIDFPEAGTFDYHCKYHPEMTGTIIVE